VEGSVLLTGTGPAAIGKSEVFRAGMTAAIAVFSIAWMADTVFDANPPALEAALADVPSIVGLCHGAAGGLAVRQLAGCRHQRSGSGGAGDRRATLLPGRLRRRRLRRRRLRLLGPRQPSPSRAAGH